MGKISCPCCGVEQEITLIRTNRGWETSFCEKCGCNWAESRRAKPEVPSVMGTGTMKIEREESK